MFVLVRIRVVTGEVNRGCSNAMMTQEKRENGNSWREKTDRIEDKIMGMVAKPVMYLYELK